MDTSESTLILSNFASGLIFVRFEHVCTSHCRDKNYPNFFGVRACLFSDSSAWGCKFTLNLENASLKIKLLFETKLLRN